MHVMGAIGEVDGVATRDARTARREIGTGVTSGWGAAGDGCGRQGRVGRVEARRERGGQMARGRGRCERMAR